MSRPYDIPQVPKRDTWKTWTSHNTYQQELAFTAINIKPQGNVRENEKAIIAAPGVLMGTLYRPQQLQSLACKTNDQIFQNEISLFGRHDSHIPGVQPVGDMRGDPRGLASDWRFTTNTALPVKRDNFYAWRGTRLGQPK